MILQIGLIQDYGTITVAKHYLFASTQKQVSSTPFLSKQTTTQL